MSRNNPCDVLSEEEEGREIWGEFLKDINWTGKGKESTYFCCRCNMSNNKWKLFSQIRKLIVFNAKPKIVIGKEIRIIMLAAVQQSSRENWMRNLQVNKFVIWAVNGCTHEIRNPETNNCFTLGKQTNQTKIPKITTCFFRVVGKHDQNSEKVNARRDKKNESLWFQVIPSRNVRTNERKL